MIHKSLFLFFPLLVLFVNKTKENLGILHIALFLKKIINKTIDS